MSIKLIRGRYPERYFSGKRVLITGGARGLGRNLSLRLLQEKARVIAIGRTQENLEILKCEAERLGLAEGLEVRRCNVADREAVSQTVSELLKDNSSIQIAILNAGVKYSDRTVLHAELIRQTFDVNFFGVLNCLECILPHMIEHNHGQIVIISSLGAYHGMKHANGYNASKAALSNLAESLRIDLQAASSKIVITLASPGLIPTNMVQIGGWLKFLMTDRMKAINTIVHGIAARKMTIAFPFIMWVAAVVLSLLPKRLEARIIAHLEK